MQAENGPVSAARLTAGVFGVLAGLGGLIHGIGEVLQGNVAPDGIIINSWTRGPIATNMGGEPGMTVVSNLRVTGVLTILASLAALVWAVAFVPRKHGGRVMILLSIAMLLVGGGFGPPLMGILAGVAGTGINAPSTGWPSRVSGYVRRFLAQLWPLVFGVAAVTGTFLVVGSVILVFIFGLNKPNLFPNSFYLTVLSLLLTVLTGRAYDVQRGERPALGLD